MSFKMLSYQTTVPHDANTTVVDMTGEFAGTYQVHVQNAGFVACYIITSEGPYTLQPEQEVSFSASGDLEFAARCYNSPITAVDGDSTLVQVMLTGESA